PTDKMSIRAHLEPGTGALNQGVDLGAVDAVRDASTTSARLGGSKSTVSFAQEGTPQPVTVRGRPGTCTYVVDTGSAIGEVVVELADGRWLAVSANGPSTRITRPVLLRMAEELVIGPDPTIDWQR